MANPPYLDPNFFQAIQAYANQTGTNTNALDKNDYNAILQQMQNANQLPYSGTPNLNFSNSPQTNTTGGQPYAYPQSLEDVDALYKKGYINKTQADQYELSIPNQTSSVQDSNNIDNNGNLLATDQQWDAARQQSSNQQPFLPFLSFTGSDLNTDAWKLGASIGQPNGTPGKTLGTIGAAGSFLFGSARNFLSGLSYQRANKNAMDYINNQRNNPIYTPSSQYQNQNNTGGVSTYKYGGLFDSSFADGGFISGDDEKVKQKEQQDAARQAFIQAHSDLMSGGDPTVTDPNMFGYRMPPQGQNLPADQQGAWALFPGQYGDNNIFAQEYNAFRNRLEQGYIDSPYKVDANGQVSESSYNPNDYSKQEVTLRESREKAKQYNKYIRQNNLPFQKVQADAFVSAGTGTAKFADGGEYGDPPLTQAQQDSLMLYNGNKKYQDYFSNVVEPLLKKGQTAQANKLWASKLAESDKEEAQAFERLKKLNGKYPTPVETINSKYVPHGGFMAALYAKPSFLDKEITPLPPLSVGNPPSSPIGVGNAPSFLQTWQNIAEANKTPPNFIQQSILNSEWVQNPQTGTWYQKQRFAPDENTRYDINTGGTTSDFAEGGTFGGGNPYYNQQLAVYNNWNMPSNFSSPDKVLQGAELDSWYQEQIKNNPDLLNGDFIGGYKPSKVLVSNFDNSYYPVFDKPNQNTLPTTSSPLSTQSMTAVKNATPSYYKGTFTSSANPNATASFNIPYTSNEERAQILKDFAAIKTEQDYKNSDYYKRYGDKVYTAGTSYVPAFKNGGTFNKKEGDFIRFKHGGKMVEGVIKRIEDGKIFL